MSKINIIKSDLKIFLLKNKNIILKKLFPGKFKSFLEVQPNLGKLNLPNLNSKPQYFLSNNPKLTQELELPDLSKLSLEEMEQEVRRRSR